MQDRVQGAFNVDVVCYIMFDEQEPVVTGQMLNVSGVAGNQIVHSDDSVAFGQKMVTKVRA